MECTLVREQDLHQPDYDYVPDILKEGVVRYRHFPADEDGVKNRQESGSEEINPAYGTFDENKWKRIIFYFLSLLKWTAVKSSEILT